MPFQYASHNTRNPSTPLERVRDALEVIGGAPDRVTLETSAMRPDQAGSQPTKGTLFYDAFQTIFTLSVDTADQRESQRRAPRKVTAPPGVFTGHVSRLPNMHAPLPKHDTSPVGVGRGAAVLLPPPPPHFRCPVVDPGMWSWQRPPGYSRYAS